MTTGTLVPDSPAPYITATKQHTNQRTIPAGKIIVEIEGTFICPYCLQISTILVDVSAGEHQELIEDCQVCCRPARLKIEVDADTQEANIAADIP